MDITAVFWPLAMPIIASASVYANTCASFFCVVVGSFLSFCCLYIHSYENVYLNKLPCLLAQLMNAIM